MTDTPSPSQVEPAQPFLPRVCPAWEFTQQGFQEAHPWKHIPALPSPFPSQCPCTGARPTRDTVLVWSAGLGSATTWRHPTILRAAWPAQVGSGQGHSPCGSLALGSSDGESTGCSFHRPLPPQRPVRPSPMSAPCQYNASAHPHRAAPPWLSTLQRRHTEATAPFALDFGL